MAVLPNDSGAIRLLLEDLEEARGEEDSEEDLSFLFSWIGSVRHAAGDLEGALQAFREALSVLHDGDEAQASESQREAFEESAASVYLEMCEIQAQRGAWAEADDCLARAVDLSRLDPWVQRHLPGFRSALAERRVPPHADPLAP